VVVVLGAYSDAIEHELRELPVNIVQNSKWQTGLGSSIKTGLEVLSAMETASAAPTDGVLLMLGDQPFITATQLDEMARCYSVNGGIVASAYCNTLGAPVIFGPEFHQELASLEPGQGAKCVIDRHPGCVKAIDCAAGVVDIDTQEDYDQLVKSDSLMLFRRPGISWSEGAD
jgi:molybdenum cofactor cytidylyltransferase